MSSTIEPNLKPDWVNALQELENYAREQRWRYSLYGHAALIRRLIKEHRELIKHLDSAISNVETH